VVLSTVLEAAEKDYDLTVLFDCCADADEISMGADASVRREEK
jgi:nicotinamidase-related amidase